MEVVCGAWNFEVGDLVPLAPVGAVLPGGFAIGTSEDEGRRLQRHALLGPGAQAVRRPRGHPAPQRGRGRGSRAGPSPRPWASSPTWSSTSPSRPTAPTPGASPVWPGTWPPGSAAVRHPRPGAGPGGPGRRRGRAAGAGGTAAGRRWPPSGSTISSCAPGSPARVVTGVRSAPSPQWLARRLTLAGMRPINNVVDASNYVMLELGQPTHPYDLDRLAGHGLVVRRARPGETVVTLDGIERTLGRPGPGPRRHRAGLPHLRRRGVAGGHRRRDGRRLLGDRRRHLAGPARGRLLRSHGHRPDVEAAGAADRGVRPLRAGMRPRGDRPGRRAVLRAAGPDRRAGDDRGRRGHRRPGRRARARAARRPAGRGSTHCSAPSFDRRRHRRPAGPLGITRRRPAAAGTGRRSGSPCPPSDPTSARRRWARRTSPRRWPGPTATRGSPGARRRGPSPAGSPTTQRERRLLKDVLCGLGGEEAWTATFVIGGRPGELGLRRLPTWR